MLHTVLNSVSEHGTRIVIKLYARIYLNCTYLYYLLLLLLLVYRTVVST